MFRSVELYGFKTFASRTRFDFDGALTAVIGPNGSGKSNVADALRWILGEPGGRGLRVRRAEDLIFAGGSGRAASGFAEVTITLDNAHGAAPLDFAEIVITRRVHRAGDSDYWINRQRARSRDVLDVLTRVGSPPSAYAVIGQGLIDQALSLRPEERRELIEEAADVRRHHASLEDARARLAATMANVQRVADLLAEIGPRVEKLRQEAAAAAEHERLASDLAVALAQSYATRWRVATAAMTEADTALHEAQRRFDRACATQSELAERLSRLRQQGASARSRHERIIAELRQVEATTDREQNAAAAARQTADRLRDDVTRAEAEVVELDAQAAREREALIESQSLLDRLRAEIATLAAAQGARRADQQEAQRRTDAAKAALDAAQRDLTAVETAYQRDALLIERLRGDLLAMTTDQQPTAIDPDDDEDSVAGAQSAEAAILAELEQALAEQRAARASLNDRETRLAALRVESASLGSRRREFDRRLEDLARDEASGSGLLPAVRVVLERAGIIAVVARGASRAGEPTLSGVIGTVADLITVPSGLEAAFEAALGARSQDIVVERWHDAEAAIDLLRAVGAGRATFLPLDTVQHGRLAEAPREDGVIGLAAQLCECAPRYRGIVARLLGSTVVVEELAVARRCLQHGARGLQFVTTAGDTVSAWGAITGGSRHQRRDGLWRRRAERAAVVAERDRLAARHDEAEAEARRMTDEIARARQIDADWARRVTDLEAQRQRAARATALAIAREERRLAQRAEYERQDARRAAQRAELLAQIDDLEARQVVRAAQLPDARARVAAATEALAAVERDATIVRGDETSLKNQVAGLEATARSASATVERGQAAIDRARAAANRARHRAIEREHERQEALAQAARREQAIAALLAQSQALQSRAERAVAELQLVEREEQEALDAERAARSDVTRASEEVADAQRRRDAASTAMESLLRRMDADGLAVADVMAAPVPDEPPEEVERRVLRLRSRLRAMPPVNARAIADYEAERERMTTMTAQSVDLTAAAANLERTIATLEKRIADQFDATFAAVNAEFRHYFHRLFNGGSARLGVAATSGEPGIEIEANPPGKKPQSLAMLSGGERALTAAALIFALLKVNPIPFCVLDEVDAALDEINVRRFVDALKELSDRTQFVVITHNRVTIEAAPVVYGLTANPDGSTKAVSLRLGPTTDASPPATA